MLGKTFTGFFRVCSIMVKSDKLPKLKLRPFCHVGHRGIGHNLNFNMAICNDKDAKYNCSRNM